MTKSKNINMFLIDGDVTGRIKCTMTNWTGIVFKIPRNRLSDVKDRRELKQSGIYFLVGRSDDSDRDQVYIGQSGVRKNGQGALLRISEHTKDQHSEYFYDAIVLTTQNDSFGQTEISYLENRFTNIAKEVNRYEVMNSNEPMIGNVSEEKQSELEEVIKNANMLIGALGYKFLIPMKNSSRNKADVRKEIFYLSRFSNKSKRNIIGTAERTSEGILVLAGSDFEMIDSKVIPPNVEKIRNEFINKGKIKDGKVIEDVLFTSPSSAAGFLIGMHTNGRTDWKDSEGRTLKEIEEKEMEQIE